MAKILYLTDGYTPHDYRFLAALAQSGHEIWFQPMRGDKRTDSRPVPEKVKALPGLGLAGASWPYALWKLRRHIRQIQPDVVHAGPVQTGGLAAALLHLHPMILMSWGSDMLVTAHQNAWVRALSRYAVHGADMVLADCEAVETEVIGLAGQPPQGFVRLPWGIDTKLFRPGLPTAGFRARLQWEGLPVFINTRGFEPIHAPLELLEGFKRASGMIPDLRLVLIGEGSLRSQVEKFIAQHDLSAHIHLAGRILNTDLPGWFNESNVYVSSTRSDGSSISLLEAMGCGLPAIVTQAYGNPEWVKSGENGWLYNSGDSASLARVILEAIRQQSEWKKIGERNCAAVQQRANWGDNFPKLLQAYDKLLEG